MQVARSTLVPGLKDDAADGTRPGRALFARSVFAAGEIALAVVLVIASFLLGRSLANTQTIPLGIDTDQQIIFLDVLPGVVGYAGQRSLGFLAEAAERVRSVPGVEWVSLALRIPLSPSGGGAERRVATSGLRLPQGQRDVRVKFNAVGVDYFETVGTRLLSGRTFVRSDDAQGVRPVVISETMARRFWPGTDVIGRHLAIEGRDHEVVGVVEDVKINDIHEAPEPYMYVPFAEAPSGDGTLILNTRGDPRAVVGAVRDRIHGLDKNVPVSVRTVDDVLQLAFYQDRMATGFVAVLGMLGLFLAAIGLYGVIAHGVLRRTHEIGIRIALGASRRGVVQLVLTRALRLALVGIGAGLIGAFGVTRFMSSLLYGIRPTDPLAFAFGGGVALFVTILATWIPAARAVKVDPIVAIRSE